MILFINGELFADDNNTVLNEILEPCKCKPISELPPDSPVAIAFKLERILSQTPLTAPNRISSKLVKASPNVVQPEVSPIDQSAWPKIGSVYQEQTSHLTWTCAGINEGGGNSEFPGFPSATWKGGNGEVREVLLETSALFDHWLTKDPIVEAA